MRLLHTMLRVGNLQRSIDFYTQVMGMKLLRTSENPEYKYSLAFVGYGNNPDHAELELTYNWGTESYEMGTAYGHIALGVPDAYAACEKNQGRWRQSHTRSRPGQRWQHRDRIRDRPGWLQGRADPARRIRCGSGLALNNRRMEMIDLRGQRILVTQAQDFMGPALCHELRACGAEVIADDRVLTAPQDAQAMIEEAGPLDALVINLALPAPSTPVTQIDEVEWQQVFEVMVDPLPRLVRAVVPGMKARGGGKIVVMGSASALRGMKRAASYSAARGAQLAYVQAAGVELAPDNIQLNAVAQNFVDNPTYFPAEVQANPRFQERLKREVPLGRLVKAEEDARFVAYLCSNAASCFVGQVFPMSGGWAVR